MRYKFAVLTVGWEDTLWDRRRPTPSAPERHFIDALAAGGFERVDACD